MIKYALKLARYWWWYHRDLRTRVMPLGHGVVAVTSGFIGGVPMMVMVPLRDRDIGAPGTAVSADIAVSLEGLASLDDLPRGSVVLTFKDEHALWLHRDVTHRLWTAVVDAKAAEA